MKRKLLSALLCAAALCCLCAGALAGEDDALRIVSSEEIVLGNQVITIQIYPDYSGTVEFRHGNPPICEAYGGYSYVFAGYRVHDLNGPISSSGTSDPYAQFGTVVESIGTMSDMEHPVFTAIFEKVNVAVSPAGAGSAYYEESIKGFVAEPNEGYRFLGWKYVVDEWSEPLEYTSTAARWSVPLPSATGTYKAYFENDGTAYCVLSPTAFTLTKSDYTDIPVELTSLVLGKVWDSDYEVYRQAEAVSFQLHGGTLTDAAGHSIPFQVADANHAAHGNGARLNTWHTSQGETVIMPVWIDDSDFGQAAPGTYTGTLTYDALWKCWHGTYDLSFPYGSGQIALTLVVPGPAPDFGPATFTLPADLTTLGASAFAGDAVITVVDARHVTAIGPKAFANCANLTQIRLPENCDIDATAFTDCGAVYVYAPAGGTTQEKCDSIPNCVFVADSAN